MTKTKQLAADSPECLDVAGVAGWLGCHTDLVYKLIARKELPSFRIGRHIRVHRDQLLKFASKSA